MAGVSAHGTVVKRNSVAIPELLLISPPELSRPMIERTRKDEADDAFLAGRRRVGDLSFSVQLVIGDPSHLGLYTAYGADSLDTYEIDFADGAVWQFDGYVIDMAHQAPVDDALVLRVVVRPAGALSFSASTVSTGLEAESGDFLVQETGDYLLQE